MVVFVLMIGRTCTSSLYASSYRQLMEEFGCSQEVAILGLSLFVIGLAIGPMVMSPLSEVSYFSVSPGNLLTLVVVLWSQTHLCVVHDILPPLVDSLRSCAEHRNDACGTFL